MEWPAVGVLRMDGRRSDTVGEVGNDSVDAHVLRAPNVFHIVDGIGEDLLSEVVERLQQDRRDGRKVKSNVGRLHSHYIGDGIMREAAMVQNHELGIGVGMPHAVQFGHHERGINERTGEAGAFHYGAGFVSDALHLEFENHADGSSGYLQGLFQRGDALRLARVEPLHLLEGHLRHLTGLISGAVDGLVME